MDPIIIPAALLAGMAGGATVKWGRFKWPSRKPKTLSINDDRLAHDLLRVVQEHVVEETVHLRDMARSDDPIVQDAMQGIAKNFLLANRGYFR